MWLHSSGIRIPRIGLLDRGPNRRPWRYKSSDSGGSAAILGSSWRRPKSTYRQKSLVQVFPARTGPRFGSAVAHAVIVCDAVGQRLVHAYNHTSYFGIGRCILQEANEPCLLVVGEKI